MPHSVSFNNILSCKLLFKPIREIPLSTFTRKVVFLVAITSPWQVPKWWLFATRIPFWFYKGTK